jgi:hypothetical protein
MQSITQMALLESAEFYRGALQKSATSCAMKWNATNWPLQSKF